MAVSAVTATARRIIAILAIAGAVLGLAACDKPTPTVTAQSGATALNIHPSTYCYDGKNCKQHKPDVPTLTVAPNSSILLDVPRQLVGRGWAVQALNLGGTTTLASSGRITNSHSYRLAPGVNNGNPFIVQVLQLDGTKADGSTWSFVVELSPTKT